MLGNMYGKIWISQRPLAQTDHRKDHWKAVDKARNILQSLNEKTNSEPSWGTGAEEEYLPRRK